MSPGPRFAPRALTDAEAQAMVARGIPPEARRHQARVVVDAAGSASSWSGSARGSARSSRVDETSCVLTTGAERIEELAAYLGLLGADFRVSEPPELVEALRVLAGRYAAATA